jgi:hypothetical protein
LIGAIISTYITVQVVRTDNSRDCDLCMLALNRERNPNFGKGGK